MAHGRAYHNLTLLPDGTVLASGGGSRSDGVDLTKSVLPAEIWNPDTETWTTVDSLQNGRQYHSTALLLPDGRVLMAGGGAVGGAHRHQRTPRSTRRRTSSRARARRSRAAPATMAYGASFDVTTPNAAQIAQVSLIRSPSVTHALDMNQRFQFLNFTAGAGKVTVDGAGEREPRAARRLHALPRRHERRAVGRLVHPRDPGAAVRRHDAADRLGDGAGQRRDVSGTIERDRERDRQRRGRGRAVQARRREPRRRGHDAPRTRSSWDTTTAPNGPHTLTAVARDLHGQRGDVGRRAR